MDLLASFALCTLSALGYTLVRSHARRLGSRSESFVLGLVFGLGAIVSMSAPLQLQPDVAVPIGTIDPSGQVQIDLSVPPGAPPGIVVLLQCASLRTGGELWLSNGTAVVSS